MRAANGARVKHESRQPLFGETPPLAARPHLRGSAFRGPRSGVRDSTRKSAAPQLESLAGGFVRTKWDCCNNAPYGIAVGPLALRI